MPTNAVQTLTQRVIAGIEEASPALLVLLSGDTRWARASSTTRVPVMSAGGSTAMGCVVGQKVAARFGRAILEVGGNNAAG